MAHQHHTHRSWMHFVLSLILVLSCLGLRPVQTVSAQSFELQVDTTVDTNAPSFQACNNNVPDDCSLRGAITRANNSDPSDYFIIRLDGKKTYTLTLSGANEDDNATGDLDIRRRLEIIGGGATVDGGGLDRVFDIYSTDTVYLYILRITGGHAPDGAAGTAEAPNGLAGAHGGGINLRGPSANVYMAMVRVFGNSAGRGGNGYAASVGSGGNGGYGGFGGGIYAAPGTTLHHEFSMIYENSAGNGGDGGRGGDSINGENGGNGGRGGGGGGGGGIYWSGNNMNWNYNRIYGNHAGNGGSGGVGGAGEEAANDNAPGTNGGRGGDGGWPGVGGGVFADQLGGLREVLIGGNTAGNGGNGGQGGQGGQGGASSYGGDGGSGGSGGEGGNGGGLAINVFTSFINSAIYQNHAGNGGSGGLGGEGGAGGFANGTSGEIGNAGPGGSGGAIAMVNTSKSAEIDFSTIVYNTSGYDGVGAGVLPDMRVGGMIFTGEVKMKNTILYFNTDAGSTQPRNCQTNYPARLYSGGGNFIESLNYCSYETLPEHTKDYIGVDPQLTYNADADQTLSMNTPYVLPYGSPAIDVANCLTWEGGRVETDQRHQPRHSHTACDSGAYEYQFNMNYAPMMRK